MFYDDCFLMYSTWTAFLIEGAVYVLIFCRMSFGSLVV